MASRQAKEAMALVEEAVAAGATYVGLTKHGHHKLIFEGQPIFLASTPSCYRSVKNARALLRRKGVPLSR